MLSVAVLTDVRAKTGCLGSGAGHAPPTVIRDVAGRKASGLGATSLAPGDSFGFALVILWVLSQNVTREKTPIGTLGNFFSQMFRVVINSVHLL